MGVSKVAKEIAVAARGDGMESFWENRRQQNKVVRIRRLEDFASPGCPFCGYPSELGSTVTGRRAWFCCNKKCQFFDSAVVSVLIGVTDTLANYKKALWETRMKSPFYQDSPNWKKANGGERLVVAWKTEVGG